MSDKLEAVAQIEHARALADRRVAEIAETAWTEFFEIDIVARNGAASESRLEIRRASLARAAADARVRFWAQLTRPPPCGFERLADENGVQLVRSTWPPAPPAPGRGKV